MEKYLGEVDFREILLEIWDSLHEIAPFAFRTIDEINTYVGEAKLLESGELRSSSFIQRPDIALEVQFPDGSHLVYIFDPKYKFESETPENIEKESRPKQQDIDKMHAYCHAIRDNKGQEVVRYAAILYPGSFETYPDAQIEALPAYPSSDEFELKKHLSRVLSNALNQAG